MKHKLIFGLVFALFAVAALFAFNTKKGVTVEKISDSTGATEIITDYGFGTSAPGIIYQKTWDLDTLANAATETLTFSTGAPLAILASNFTYNYYLERTNISGTTNITATLEESNERTGTKWYTLGTFSGTGASNVTVTGTNTLGVRHRVKLVGSGTQSTSFRVTATYKKIN